MKKNHIMTVSLLISLLVGMSACSNSTADVATTKEQETSDNQNSERSSETIETSTESIKEAHNDTDSESDTSENSNDEATDNPVAEDSNSPKEEKETLANYSSEQIEYARVWLQLGPNQAIDELNVLYIPADTPLNPDDHTSANYPEDVIQLAGSRLVDGSITYSGNGNGTINVYNVPLRWDGQYPAGEKFYTDIINNTKLVSIDPGDDEEIIKLIKLLNVHH